jgi:hypothetical protein
MARGVRVYNAYETERMRELNGVELASFTSRAVALLIDFAIAGALFLGGLILFFKSQTATPVSTRTINTSTSNLSFSRTGTASFTWCCSLGFRFTWAMAAPSARRMMAFAWYGAAALEFGFGFAQYFIHPNRRTVHDHMAETIVIRDKRGGLLTTQFGEH